METLTRLIHDIIVNVRVQLEFVKQLRQVTDNRYLHLSSFHNRYTFFFRREFFHIFFLTVNISTLHQFLEPNHFNFFSHLITHMVVIGKLVSGDYENIGTGLISKV